MMNMRINSTRWLVLTLAIAMMVLLGMASALAAPADYTCVVWVEAPNIAGDPGDPTIAEEMLENYIIFSEETRRAEAGSVVSMTQNAFGEYLLAPNGRRFARFSFSDSAAVAADGSTVINAYYKRGVFTYEFALGLDQAEMKIGETLYKNNGEMYTIEAKYGQEVAFPGIDNGLLPISTNIFRADAKCVGWTMDERTGSTQSQAISFAPTIIESLLPTDAMPYDDMVFRLTGAWFNNPNIGMVACWFEQTPEESQEAESEELKRTTYNGTTYVNYPATNFPFVLPEGTHFAPGKAAGLELVASIAPEDPKQDNTWQLIYTRERYNVSFNTNGAAPIDPATGLMYQQNLYMFDLGWTEGTITTINNSQMRFDGWYNSKGQFLGYSLAGIWMPAGNLNLEAKWVRAN